MERILVYKYTKVTCVTVIGLQCSGKCCTRAYLLKFIIAIKSKVEMSILFFFCANDKYSVVFRFILLSAAVLQIR